MRTSWLKKYESRNITEEEKKYYYDKYSAAAVEQFVNFIEVYKQDLSEITEPVLIIQLSNDNQIDSNSANYIYQNVKSKDKNLIIIGATGHGLFDGDYKRSVYQEVYNFVKRV